MAEKLHLHAGILRIHGFDVKLLRADNLHILFIHVVLLNKLLPEKARPLFLIYQLVLILLKLSLDNLLNQINRHIHITADLLGTDDISLHRNRHFDLLTILLHTERNMHFRILGKKLLQLTDLVLHCCP